MIATVPLPDLLDVVRRVVHSGCRGWWLTDQSAPVIASVPVRCYITDNFAFATIVARRADLPRFSSCAGRLKISPTGDETVLLSFCPTITTLLAETVSDTGALVPLNQQQASLRPESEPVLICGKVLAVEFQVPSHAIDVMASTRSSDVLRLELCGVGLN